MKYCNKCNTDKPLSEFYSCKRNGLQSKCKDCEKAYKLATKDNDKINKRNHYLKHKDKIKARVKEYSKKHKYKMQKAMFVKHPEKKILHNQRTRINGLLKSKKSTSTIKLLGCTISEFKQYLESQFTKGMSWDNYGLFGWHVDHIIPCSMFNLFDDNDLRQCFHYTNMQPLWAKDNLLKSDKILKPTQTNLPL